MVWNHQLQLFEYTVRLLKKVEAWKSPCGIPGGENMDIGWDNLLYFDSFQRNFHTSVSFRVKVVETGNADCECEVVYWF